MAIGWSRGPRRPDEADPAPRRAPVWLVPMLVLDALILLGIVAFVLWR